MTEVTVAKDWLDYAVAIGSLFSLIVAVVAIMLAWRSAKDAKGSARFAEELRDIAAEEREARRAEEAKRAELDFSLGVHIKPPEPDGRSICRLELSSRNTGQRPAAPAIFSVTVGRGATVFKCDPDGEQISTQNPTPQDEYEIQWGDGTVRAVTAWEELTIQVKTVRATSYVVIFPEPPGVYECWASLSYEGTQWNIAVTGTRDQDGILGVKRSPVEVSSASDSES